MKNLFLISLIPCIFAIPAPKKSTFYLIETEDGAVAKRKGGNDYNLHGPDEEEGPAPYDVGTKKAGPEKGALENAIDGGSLNEEEDPEPYGEDKKTMAATENAFEGGMMNEEQELLDMIDDEEGPESYAEKSTKPQNIKHAFEAGSHKQFEEKSFHHDTKNAFDGGSINKGDVGPEPYPGNTWKTINKESAFEGGSVNEEDEGPESYAEDKTKSHVTESPFEGGSMNEEDEGPESYAEDKTKTHGTESPFEGGLMNEEDEGPDPYVRH